MPPSRCTFFPVEVITEVAPLALDAIPRRNPSIPYTPLLLGGRGPAAFCPPISLPLLGYGVWLPVLGDVRGPWLPDMLGFVGALAPGELGAPPIGAPEESDAELAGGAIA